MTMALRSSVIRLAIAALVAVGAATSFVLVRLSSGPVPVAVASLRPTHPSYTYSCCRAFSAAYHPGGAVQVRWIVGLAPAGTAGPALPVTLSATIFGPFPGGADVKESSIRSTLAAATIKTTSWTGGNPITKIELPPTTPPGLYDIQTVVTYGDGIVASNSVLRVTK